MMAHCGDGIESDNNPLLFNRILSFFCIITPYFCTVYSSLTPKPLRGIKSSSSESYLRCLLFDDFREPGVVKLLSLAD